MSGRGSSGQQTSFIFGSCSSETPQIQIASASCLQHKLLGTSLVSPTGMSSTSSLKYFKQMESSSIFLSTKSISNSSSFYLFFSSFNRDWRDSSYQCSCTVSLLKSQSRNFSIFLLLSIIYSYILVFFSSFVCWMCFLASFSACSPPSFQASTIILSSLVTGLSSKNVSAFNLQMVYFLQLGTPRLNLVSFKNKVSRDIFYRQSQSSKSSGKGLLEMLRQVIALFLVSSEIELGWASMLEDRFNVASFCRFSSPSTFQIWLPERSKMKISTSWSRFQMRLMRLLARLRVTNLVRWDKFSILLMTLLLRQSVLMLAQGSRLSMFWNPQQ